MSVNQRHSLLEHADLFFNDLCGPYDRRPGIQARQQARPSPRSAGPVDVFDRLVHQQASESEVFFDDDGDSIARGPWRVIAMPHSSTPLAEIHHGDLVIQRALGEGRLVALRVVGDDVEASALYDSNGVIRRDTIVLREVRPATAPPMWAAPVDSPVEIPEDIPSVVGSPRRTEAEWWQAASAGFIGKIPRRTDVKTGSEALASLMEPSSSPKDWDANLAARNSRDLTLLKEIINGNFPGFLREGAVVTVKFRGKDGADHTINYQVMKEYLAVGNIRDHVTVPLQPGTAQKIADQFGCILPTAKMVEQIFDAAGAKLNAPTRGYWSKTYDPTTDKKLVTHEYDSYLKRNDRQVSTASYLEHNLAVKQQLSAMGVDRAKGMPLVAGHKKDLVIAARPNPKKLQFYGFFLVTKQKDGTVTGKPIQAQSGRNIADNAHDPSYVDYSHGVRLVSGSMLVDGAEMTAAEVLAHKVYSWGLSSEGPIKSPRVPGVPLPPSYESIEALSGDVGQTALQDVAPDPRTKPGAVTTLPLTKSPPHLEIVAATNAPLINARWSVHQKGRVFQGIVDSNGSTGPIDRVAGKFDPQQPFTLHVEGCVCNIVSGAALLADEAGVEYGGQFLDWHAADDADFRKSSAFWDLYKKVRTHRESLGVFRFIQHDHVMRRPVRMLARRSSAKFEARPLAIRVGPLVRYVDQRRALVWLELDTPGLVRITVGKATDQNQLPRAANTPASTKDWYATTVRVGGRHYAMVCLDGLDVDTAYQYTIALAPQPPIGPLPFAQREFTEAVFPRVQIYGGPAKNTLTSASLNGSEWFFFRTAPRSSESIRFAHGSCRKYPGDTDPEKRPDMLEVFGNDWLGKNSWTDWPQFFLHTGDQIYADDIGVQMATAILKHRFASVVPGPKPKTHTDVAFGAWAGRFGWRYKPKGPEPPPRPDLDDLRKLQPRVPLGTKHDIGYAIDQAMIARAQASFARTQGAPWFPYAQRVWNGLLWKIPDAEKEVPFVDLDGRHELMARQHYRHWGPPERNFRIEHPGAGDTEGVHAADYAEYAALYEQAWSVPGARKVLAHVPSFMIFDDHEVTDDWNADPEWLKIVHSTKDQARFWPMTMTDALCSYWIYQGWGNLAPEKWRDDPRVQILESCVKNGRDALPELRQLVSSRAVEVTARGGDFSKKLDWDYSLPTTGLPFFVLDLRTDRDVNGSGGVSPSKLQSIEQAIANSASPVAFLVLPVPFLLPDPILFAFRHPGFVARMAGARSTASFERDSDVEHPAGNPVWDQIKDLLKRLQQSSKLKTLVFISGDIHFSCNFDGQLKGSHRPPRMLQLISSGLRQSIAPDKRKKLRSAYQGWLNVIAGSDGVDDHRGVSITLGGLRTTRGTSVKLSNFILEPSLALVNARSWTDPKRGVSGSIPVVQQTSLVMEKVKVMEKGKLVDKDTLVAFTFLHETRPDGKALMSLYDPGLHYPNWPTDYPVATDGIGVTREHVETDEVSVSEPIVIEPTVDTAALAGGD
jgi:hypothetical protein